MENEMLMTEYLAPGADAVTISLTHDKTRGTVKPEGVYEGSDTILVEPGGSLSLTATAKKGYSFSHWEKGSGTDYTEVSANSRLILNNITESIAYRAVFEVSGVQITYVCSPENGGTITATEDFVPYIATPSGTVASLSTGIIKNSGYNFAGWEVEKTTESGQTETTELTDETAVIDFVRSDNDPVVKATITAKLEVDGRFISVSVAPSANASIVAIPANSFDSIDEVPNGYDTINMGAWVQPICLVYPDSDNYHIESVINARTGKRYEEAGSVFFETEHYDSNSDNYKKIGDHILTQVVVSGAELTGDTESIIIQVTKDDSDYESSVVTVSRPGEGGVTSGDMTSTSASATLTTTINASPNKGYMFDHWEFYQGEDLVTSTKQSMTVTVSGHHVYTAVFVPDMYEIKGNTDPVGAGSIAGVGKYRAHSDAVLEARPAAAYRFDKWTWKSPDADQMESTDIRLEIKDITEDHTVTAHFSKANPEVSLSVNPIGANSDNTVYNYARISDGSNEYTTPLGGTVSGTVTNGASVTLQAFANADEDYVFAYWVDQDGKTYNSNPYVTGSIKDDASFVAVFTKKKDKYDVKAISDPDEGGTFTGEGKYEPHSSATVTAVPNAEYEFEKWTWRTIDGFDHENDNATVTVSDIMEDYTLTAHFHKKNPRLTIKASPVDDVGGKFNYVTAYDTAGNSVTTSSSGEADMVSSGDASVTLQAFANEDNDYVFAYWVDKDGNTSPSNPYVIGKIKKDQEYTAIFTRKKDRYDVKLVSDPDEGGTLTGEGRYDAHSNVVVTATANDGYTFDKWTWTAIDGAVHESTDATVTIEDIKADHVLTAHFHKEEPRLTIKASPVDELDGKFNYVTASDTAGNSVTTSSSGEADMVSSGDASVTLQAFADEDNDNVFAYWVDKDGNTSPSNPYVIGKIKKDQEYTAIFTKKKDRYDVKLVSDPDEGGTLTGEGRYDAHSNVVVTATANDGYTFDKWTWTAVDGGAHESTDATVTIEDIKADHVLTAHFIKTNPKIKVEVSPLGEKEGGYNYADISDTDGNSSSTGSDGRVSMTVSGKAIVTLKAVPNKEAGYKFAYWVDQDGNASAVNPFIIGRASKDMTYTAIFTTDKDSDRTITVLASPPSGGKVSAKRNSKGGYKISAKENKGYDFKYWKCKDTGKTVTKEKTFVISKEEASKSYTYIAYFEGNGEKDPSDITDEYFPNIRRLFSQPIYKYTRDYWVSYVTGLISSIRGGNKKADGVPVTYSAYATAEKAMDEKAQNSKETVVTAQGELVTTDNEIIPTAGASETDEIRELAEKITADKFGNRYKSEILCVRDVTAPEGFEDGTRTYLWYNTGAHYDDNLFMICDQDGKDTFVAPVCDREGVLTFTTPKLGASNRFILVRVLIM
ncbi:MAG: InlB B-repeat-containing protein [Lachnospiraceae bacterium]|nr:InlB B-repeat-containing protein [Lachnospiraceae bacterium]